MNKLLIYSAWLRRGGAERVTVRLAEYMVSHGIPCDIVTSHKSSDEYELPCGVGRICLKHLNIFSLRKVIAGSGADTVLVMGVPNCLYVIPACMGLNVRVAVSERNDPSHCAARPIVRVLSRSLMRFADAFVFQTQSAKDYYAKILGGRGEVIANPVFADETAGERAHRIVSVGRLVAQKNHKMLISAFEKVLEKHGDFILDIYGDGSLRSELERLIASKDLVGRVRLCGNVRDVHSKIKDSTAFVMTSDFEGMPNALAEAMSMGLACISTDCPCGGAAQLIENGKNGILVPVGDADAAANAMLKVIEDADCAKRLGENAAKIKDKLNPETVGRKWLEYLGNAGLSPKCLNKTKVIELITSMDCGGAQTVVRDWARFLDKSKFDVTVVTTSASTGSHNEKVLKESGVRTYYTGSLLPKPLVKMLRRRLVGAIIKREKPDIIHCHLGAVRFLKFDLPCPVVYTIHSDVGRFFEGKNGKCVDKLVRSGKIHLTALHKKMASELKARYGGDYPVFENSADKTAFATDRRSVRRALGIDADAFVVGHVGRFVPVKNHAFLIEIFSQVLKIKPDSYLLLVGGGELLNGIKSLAERRGIADRVIFTGERSDVPSLLDAMDVFCMPSLSEGAPLALAEARAAGLGCVVSDSVFENAPKGGICGISTDEDSAVWARAVCDCKGSASDASDIRETVKKLEIYYEEVTHYGKIDSWQ